MAEENAKASDKKTGLWLWLEKVCEYRMPPRWVAFAFLLQLFTGASIIIFLRPSLVQLFVAVDVLLFCVWLVNTGRVVFRLKTADECRADAPASLLSVSGAVMIASAASMCVGQNGIASFAGGARNSFTYHMNVLVPLAFLVGLVDIIAARKKIRILSWPTAFANYAVGATAVGTVGNVLYSYRRDPMSVFSNRYTDLAEILAGSGDLSYPLQPLTTYHSMRIVPLCLVAVLAAVSVFKIVMSLLKIAIAEEEERPSKASGKKTTRCLPASALGFLAIITSLGVLYHTCQLESVSNVAFIAPTSATLLGVVALGQMKRSSGWSKTFLILLAGSACVASYQSIGVAQQAEHDLARELATISQSKCDNTTTFDYDYSDADAIDDDDDGSKDDDGRICFAKVNEAANQRVELVCISAHADLCDGKVDVLGPVYACRDNEISRKFGYQSEKLFVDEAFCPDNRALRGLKTCGWLLTAFSILIMAAVGFSSWEEEKEEEERDDIDEIKKETKFWKKIMPMMKKVEGNGDDDDDEAIEELMETKNPILKVKFDSPC